MPNGCPWFLRSVVVRGHQRGGSLLGFPTANLFLQSATIAALNSHSNGVFFGWGVVEPDLRALPVVLSVGFNPHFADNALSVEVHFVHKFSDDFYGATVRILVVGRLRDMKKYASLDALIDDIKNDVQRGTELLRLEEVQRLSDHDMLKQAFATTDAPKFVDLSSAAASVL